MQYFPSIHQHQSSFYSDSKFETLILPNFARNFPILCLLPIQTREEIAFKTSRKHSKLGANRNLLKSLERPKLR